MNIVVAFCGTSQHSSSSASTRKSAQHATAKNRDFAKELGRCWGERIRTSDWLIQKSACRFGHADWTKFTKRDTKTGAGGQACD